MNGLTDNEVIESKKKYGSNNINVKNDNKFIKIFIGALADPIIKIMLIALLIRVVFMFSSFSWFETIGMLISILLSSLISSLNEYGSNKSFQKLQGKYEDIMVRVKRNGVILSIPNNDIVVGDIVYLESGEMVPSDGVVISGSVGVDESSINGESIEVKKNYNETVLKGTVVLSGKCIIRITAVGLNTIYGNIAKELSDKKPNSPMKIRLTKLAKVISRIGYVGAIIVSLSYLFNVFVISNNFDMNKIMISLSNTKFVIDNIIHAIILAVTIIIVCVPEGLPLMISIVLSSNMKRMVKNNVLVRKSVGIETSGSLNVLLTDKTGTLTKGNLSVIGIVTADDMKLNSLNEMPDKYKEEIEVSLLFNNESTYDNGKIIGGNSTDKAFLKFVGKIKREENIIDSIAFDSKNKYSYFKCQNGDLYYKGAFEKLSGKCIYYYDDKCNKHILKSTKYLQDILNKYTSKGIRVVTLVKNNIFIGFVLIRDEIREEAYESLRIIKEAGIHTIMITGDDKTTALVIAKELNMIDDDSIIITHDDLLNLSDDYIFNNYKKIKVIARALPSDKSRVSSILEKNGLVVGMTGDGVNDAPALKKANVGFSMGSGSEVAKEASDIVLLDDNIKSIVNAILYGRTIFKSIRKFIIFQLTMNLCALFLSIVGPFIGFTNPVTIMQMLWINMIMDTLAGLAFSYEMPRKEYLKEVPIKKDENIINKYMYSSILSLSIYSSILLIMFLKIPVIYSFIRPDGKYLLTAFFSLFIFLSVFNAFNARTSRINLFAGILKNRVFVIIISFIFIAQLYLIYFGGNLFRTYGLTITELLYVLMLSSSIIIVDIVRKLIIKYMNMI